MVRSMHVCGSVPSELCGLEAPGRGGVYTLLHAACDS